MVKIKLALLLLGMEKWNYKAVNWWAEKNGKAAKRENSEWFW